MSTASAVLRHHDVFKNFILLVPKSTASLQGVTPHMMRGPVTSLFRVFSGFRVVERNDGKVYSFFAGSHPAHDAGSSHVTLSGILWIPRRSAE